MIQIMDDPPQLSAETLKALEEFLQEQAAKQNNDNITEDWQLSQFWYDEATSSTLTSAVLRMCKPNTNIALISCPTLYPPIKSTTEQHRGVTVKLFEFDKRFAKYKTDFVFYDYNEPLNVDQKYKNIFDIVVADPPFLSEECFIKTSKTIEYMRREEYKIIMCTGAVMEDLTVKLLNLKKCSFEPKHKNNLGNEFICMTNFGEVIGNVS